MSIATPEDIDTRLVQVKLENAQFLFLNFLES